MISLLNSFFTSCYVVNNYYFDRFSAYECADPPVGWNSYTANADNSTWTFGEVAQYQCRDGYVPAAGSHTLQCKFKGGSTFWSDKPLNCESEYYVLLQQ